MNKKIVLTVILLEFIIGLSVICASESSVIAVTLQRPKGILKMGDVSFFKGTVTNVGKKPLNGLIVYLSLSCLENGKEHPEDLEDWSAQKAVVIKTLKPGETNNQNWKIRLIKAGQFAVLLTVINPEEKRPVVSDLVHFEIMPKAAIESKRVIPVAIGVPFSLLILLSLFRIFKSIQRNAKRS